MRGNLLLRPRTVFVLASKKSANTSPPMPNENKRSSNVQRVIIRVPVDVGWVTLRAAATATAASAAFPPFCRMRSPISLASG